MNKKLLKYSLVIITGSMVLASYPKTALVCGTGAMVLAANTKTEDSGARVYEEAVAGFSFDKSACVAVGITPTPILHTQMLKIAQLEEKVEEEEEGVPIYTEEVKEDIPIPGFVDIALANIDKDSNLNIRASASDDAKLVGKLPYQGACKILKEGNYWVLIQSGKVTGYVRKKFLITGTEATQLAKSKNYGDYIATSITKELNIRKSASVNSEIMDTVPEGEQLVIIDPNVITYGKEHDKWVKVTFDSDIESEGTVAGYVSKEFVTLSYELKEALSMIEIKYGADVSVSRVKLILEAQKHIGESYVWGGTTLGSGVDCSGFTMCLYKKVFGMNIPRNSRAQAQGGTPISSSQLKPGDLVFYGSNGVIGHVAIYIGNGNIIHAASRRSGIKTSSINYRTPLKYVRYIEN